jgi:(R,R)-butanediol dehydrogenase/meso-butanediol dehydrogenase/diacetyl reductase
MRVAAYTGDHALAVEERDVPSPRQDEVLVAVGYCGICGTDVHGLEMGWLRPGAVPGHEYAGEIAAIGSGVRGWHEGEAVVAEPGLVCGACSFCRSGRPSLCPDVIAGLIGGNFQGAFAEYVIVKVRQLHRIPTGLAPRAAALTEPLAVALHGITRSGVRPGETALVTGAGPIGCLTVAALKARGVGRVVVSEPAPARREAGLRCGADRAVAPDELEAPASPLADVDEPVDAVFECAGSPAAFAAGLGQLRPGGTLVIVGAGLARPTLEHTRVLLRELIVTGALNYDAGGFEDALALLAHGGLPLDQLIAPDPVRLEAIMPAVADLGAGRIGGKVMVVPS